MSAHIDRAEILIQQSRFELAEEQLRLALAQNSNDARAYALLSLCLLERDRHDDATAEARRAIEADPNAPLGYYALAMIEHRRDNHAAAHETIQQAIRLEPWNSHFFGLLAAIEASRYRWQAALDAANQGLEFDPEDVQCNNLRAIALVRLGRKDEAGATVAATLAREPENALTHANMGWTLLHQREPRRATEHFREALRIDPNLEWARLGMIEALKARHFVYRWLLAFFLWMNRFSPRTQLLLILGIVFGHSLLQQLCAGAPVLALVAGPIEAAYVLFVWMSWTAPTLFNLVLRLDRFGRLALSPLEKWASTIAGLCILVAIGLATAGVIARGGGRALPFALTAALFLGLTIPVSVAFRFHGWRQAVMAAYSVGLLAVIGLCVYQLVIVESAADWLTWWRHGVQGVVVSTWVSAGLSMISRRF
jgi:tetratricopeptide (TPR) repeat protein